jgi:hypothetical protein
MPAAVRTPTAATLPASSNAWPTGSGLLLRAAGCGAGRERGCAWGRGRGLARVVLGLARAAAGFLAGGCFFARVAEVVLRRLSLRRPGRERGRLPRTPGSSSRSAATTGKNTGPSGVSAPSHGKTERARRTWVNVGRRGFCGGAGQIRIFPRIRSEASGYTAPAPWGAVGGEKHFVDARRNQQLDSVEPGGSGASLPSPETDRNLCQSPSCRRSTR